MEQLRVVRSMVLVLMAALLAPIPLVAAAPPAAACSCAGTPDIQETYDAADVVVTGTVAAHDVGGAPSGSAVHEIAVTTVHRGEASATLRYLTPDQDGACGYAPRVGSDVVAFLVERQDGLVTSTCSGNRNGELNDDEADVVASWPAAQPLADPVGQWPDIDVDGRPVGWAWIVAGVVTAAALAGAAVLDLRTRRRAQQDDAP